jgi:precorrin-2 dehydrogenase/sirohydrochlorin ferrochelatase
VVAVGTGGASPGVARFLRESIERAYPNLDGMIALQARLRSALGTRIPDQRQRSVLLRSVLEDGEVWSALDGGEECAWALVEGRYLHV